MHSNLKTVSVIVLVDETIMYSQKCFSMKNYQFT